MKKNLLQREPAVAAGAVGSIVLALLYQSATVLQAFGVEVDAAQVDAVAGLVSLLVPIIGGLVTRFFVSPA